MLHDADPLQDSRLAPLAFLAFEASVSALASLGVSGDRRPGDQQRHAGVTKRKQSATRYAGAPKLRPFAKLAAKKTTNTTIATTYSAIPSAVTMPTNFQNERCSPIALSRSV